MYHMQELELRKTERKRMGKRRGRIEQSRGGGEEEDENYIA